MNGVDNTNKRKRIRAILCVGGGGDGLLGGVCV